MSALPAVDPRAGAICSNCNSPKPTEVKQVVRHERCQFQECPSPAEWSCRSACPDGDHWPLLLCDYHAERKHLAERCDGRHECHEHGRTFDSAYLWVRL